MKLTKKNLQLILFVIVLLFSFVYQTVNKSSQTKPVEVKNSPTLPFITITPLARQKEFVHVVRVIDGDTIEVQASDSSQKKTVRYIGMDTPEIHHPKKPVQCFGKEAAEKNSSIVLNKDIYMVKDVSETDRYGRLLRYVFLSDKNSTNSAIFVNEYLVKEGYAHASTFPPDVMYADLFVQTEREAREANKGLWNSCK